ncbi:complement component receptor 1-like protein isoform X2 [Mustelus asterias]
MWPVIVLIVAVFARTCASDNPGQCPIPPTVTFADRKNEFGIQQEFFVGRSVQYECLTGYIWNNITSDFVICQANLTWSEPLISCAPIDCKEPKDIQNGYYTTTGKTYGKMTTYYCNKGYQLLGKRNVLCTIEGWNKNTPTCDQIVCDPPGPISNGTVTQRDRWIYGMDATFSCHAGYTLMGQHTIYCTDTGYWSHDAPICQEIVCDPPGPISNGNVTQRDRWIYGMDATFSCHAGYTLIGQHTINCTDTGNWSQEAPICQEIVCDPPGPINNGNVTQRDRWIYGMDATFSCHAGYTLSGQHTINCTDTGNWSREAPICQEIVCAPPGPISNGTVTQRDRWIYGMDATFSCHAGYTLIGQHTINCTETGNWSREAPICQEIVCDPPGPIINGNVTQRDRWIYGMDATFSCHPGYTLSGQHTINCTDTGNWSREAPICQEIVCDPPGPISNGNVTQRDRWIYGMDATFSCHAGYTLSGQHTINCTDTGNWSHVAPICQDSYKEQSLSNFIIIATTRETGAQIRDITTDDEDRNSLLSSLSHYSSNGNTKIVITVDPIKQGVNSENTTRILN